MIEAICLGSKCSKAKGCRKYCANASKEVNVKEYWYVDYSTHGDYKSIDGATAQIVCKCGDSGNHKLFEAI